MLYSQRYSVGVEVDAADLRWRIVHVEETRIYANQIGQRGVQNVAQTQRTQRNIRTLPLERKYTLKENKCNQKLCRVKQHILLCEIVTVAKASAVAVKTSGRRE